MAPELGDQWSSDVRGILARYQPGSTEIPASLDVDFDRILAKVPVGALQVSLTQALHSPSSPPAAESIGLLYAKSTPQRRAELVNVLLDAVPSLRQQWPALVSSRTTADDTDLISAQAFSAMVRAAEAVDPRVIETFAGQFAYKPQITIALDRATRHIMLTSLEAQLASLRLVPDQAVSVSDDDDIFESVHLPARGPSAPPPPAPAPSFGIPTAEPEPLPRYPSVQLFQEDSPGQRGDEQDAQQPLQVNHWYQAEVSIRLVAVGVAGDRAPIREPKQSTDVELVVTARSDDFEIADPVSRIVLPPQGDSTEQAQFRIRPTRFSAGDQDRMVIEFNIFYKFNLLEIFTVEAYVARSVQVQGAPKAWTDLPTRFSQKRQMVASDLDLVTPRALHIYIEPKDQQYRMTFTMKRNGVAELAFPPANVSLNSGDLEDRISSIRKRLFEVCSSDILGAKVQGESWEFDEHLKTLAKEGSDLWSVLFEGSGGLTVIGAWLKNNPLPDGSTIQVSADPGASNFVFAWSLLYDRWSPTATPSQNGFWGLRYVIEQRPVMLTPPVPPLGPSVEIGAMCWKFDQWPSQLEYLKSMLGQSKQVALASGAAIDDAQSAMKLLVSLTSKVVYFYTHGYTGMPNADRYGFSVGDFLKLYDKLPADSDTRKAWRFLYQDIQSRQFDSDESYIELTSGRLLLTDLYKNISKLPQRPLVILNMCDSAQVTPSLSRSFIDFFLSRQALAVVGTECSMRPVFADYVGRELLTGIFQGEPVGKALLRIRLAAANQNNLLGLAYTLFGSADAALLPPLLVPATN